MNDRWNSAPSRGGIDDIESERERALDSITTAFSHGVISIEDYERRAGAIQNAKAYADIDAQILDLPRAELPRDQPRRRSSPSRRGAEPRPADDFLVESRSGSPDFSLCVMGDRKMVGDWLNSDQAITFTLMGSTTLDLRDTALPPGRLKIDAIAIMGEVRIIVPHGLPVRMSAFPFMGEANVQASVERRVDRNRPWVDVSGIALMGSITVKTA
ncbi:MAG: LiaF-related protein [Spirochaetes bacterium]|nr:LiaF-related protein [Spirochaetota bacterium]